MPGKDRADRFSALFIDISDEARNLFPQPSAAGRQVFVLRRIRDFESENGQSLIATDIGKMANMAPPNISRLLKPLEEDGLIEREKDGRNSNLHITKKGDEFLARHDEELAQSINDILARFSDEELDELYKNLQGISNFLHRLKDEDKEA